MLEEDEEGRLVDFDLVVRVVVVLAVLQEFVVDPDSVDASSEVIAGFVLEVVAALDAAAMSIMADDPAGCTVDPHSDFAALRIFPTPFFATLNVFCVVCVK